MKGNLALPMTGLIVVLAGLGLGLMAGGSHHPATAASGPPPSAPSPPIHAGAPGEFALPQDARGIGVAVVGAELTPDYLEIPARIVADPARLVRVYAPVSGRLVSLAVRPADLVRQSQVLATLASSDVAAARAAFRQAEADADVRQRDLERAQQLWRNDAIARRDVQQAEADARTAVAVLASARERLALLGVDTLQESDQVAIRAARSGVVLDVDAAPGEFLKSLDNANPLCTLADLSAVWVLGDVYEKDLASIRVGDTALVAVPAYPGETRTGRIDAIGGAVDSTSRTVKVRVVLSNPGLRLKPDMFATIRVRRAARAAVVIPAAAVLRDGTSSYVFVETRQGRFARRPVTLGRDLEGGRVQVTAGLSPGDAIVVRGADLLKVVAS